MASIVKGKSIVVAGDVALDWHIANLPDHQKTPASNEALPSRICWHFGGSLLLTDLIAEIVSNQKPKGENWTLHRVTIDPDSICPDDDRYIKSYATWAISPKTSSADDAKKPSVWRVKEFLGITQAVQQAPVKLESDTPDPDIIVLDDANRGFRGDRTQWPQAIATPGAENSQRPWIVVKMAKPLVQGDLWKELYEKWADRLIVILSVKDLRLSEVQISSELSWERTAQDVAWELVYNPRVNAISRCAHVIVSFNAAGAMWMKREENEAREKKGDIVPPKCTLLFDPLVIEGMWEQNHPGQMVGYNTCLTASIVHELMIHPDKPDLTDGVKAGLCALRRLHEEGYEYQNSGLARGKITFPFAKIAQVLESCEGKPFGVAEVQFPTRLLDSELDTGDKKPIISGTWTILQQQQAGASQLESLAAKILSQGAEAVLKDVPMGKFGDLLTVDRREIESFRSIRTLVNEYCAQEKPKRPLSIAVFGPPGSGKSFGITEVAKSLRPDEIVEITFNLSQFGGLQELNSAFHQVRDLNLTGKIPLVFWDEFDSVFEKDKFGWLRYFLVPMQDGKFMEGQILHPLGKAIFVFAGGVCPSIDDFVCEAEGLRDAKAPDFISRLRGYVNILGANPPETDNDKNVSDPFYLVRRAILLRSILWRNAPKIFENRDPKGKLNIDSSVLRALLKTRRYKHGARSMEAVIGMSNLTGKAHFDQSSLPSEAQLDLHVDGQDFLSLVREIVLEGETLERLAAINHDIYCEEMRAMGFVFGEERDDVKKTRPLLRPYAEIPEFYKESNRDAVRSIDGKLRTMGYIMIQARSDEPPFDFPGADLEQLAEMEHDRYMRDACAQGWRYGPVSSEIEKTNPTLLPWKEMTEAEIQQRYPDIADKIGRVELSDDAETKGSHPDQRLSGDIKKSRIYDCETAAIEALTSASLAQILLFHNWIQTFELDASLGSCELPVDFGAGLVASRFPGRDFANQGVFVWDPLPQALTGQDGQFAFGDVEPTGMFGGVVPLELGCQTMGFFGIETLIEGSWPMRVQVVGDQDDHLGGPQVLVGQLAQLFGKVLLGAPIRHTTPCASPARARSSGTDSPRRGVRIRSPRGWACPA